MNKIIAIIALLLSVTSVSADVFLSADSLCLKPGEKGELIINMTNSEPITAFQVDVSLPKGISFDSTYVQDDDEYIYASLTARKNSSHGLTMTIQKDGTLRLLVSSLKNKDFSGTEGPVVKITVKADDAAIKGTYAVVLKNVELATSSETSYDPPERSSTAIIYNDVVLSKGTSDGGQITGTGNYRSYQTTQLTAIPNTGYHFVQWWNDSTTNPLKFLTTESQTISAIFQANRYALMYQLDGQEYHKDTVAFGTVPPVVNTPTKEGYTFSGWTGLPATMPANDVEATGTFRINRYAVIYKVDGQETKRDSLDYGATITTMAAPTKEGYTFSGWSSAPANIPAKDVEITGTFRINRYAVIYKVDGQETKRDSLDYGATITTVAAPTKEGYTFSGWSSAPATMPAKDVEITGTFRINRYAIIYKVDGQETKRDSLNYGATITTMAAPTKEGYTFSGWSSAPATIPAKDVEITGTFRINRYAVIYKVDGQETKRDSLDYGATITTVAAPTKEGYTFSGWSSAPATMPAKDVEITGTFRINRYAVIYKVDGQETKRDSLDYGATITTVAAPTKEGYTFSGWSSAPATMPAKNVEITGTFHVNRYALMYQLDGQEYHKDSVAFGTVPSVVNAPTKEGYTFSGWTGLPATMPAKDVQATGTFRINRYAVIYKVDGQETKRDSLNYGATITTVAAPTKEGYTFSGWSSAPATMPAKNVEITGTFHVNRYALMYQLDGQEYHKDSVAFGAVPPVVNAPTKEGYTFTGWTGLPATMPAKDVQATGTFRINRYAVIYKVDGQETKRDSLNYGATITTVAAPTKEGYTFSGWSSAPATMPAKNVEITGTFHVNRYALMYQLDGQEYHKDSVAFGAVPPVVNTPTKEGYTFTGWTGLPATMPAKDVQATGTFRINRYAVIYKVDGQETKRDSLNYGATITTVAAPTKEGYTFSGWSSAPTTMPAKNVEITGTFHVNRYAVIYIVDGKWFATDSVVFGSNIILREALKKEGYTFSGWGNYPKIMPSHDIEINGSFTATSIIFISEDQRVDVYSLEGIKLKSNVLLENIRQELPHGTYIIRGQKVILK